MQNVYLLKNQHQALLDKSGNWLTCGDRKQLFRTEYKDEAINQKVEIAVKHPLIRVEMIEVALDERGLPMVDLPRPPKVEAQSETTEQRLDLEAPNLEAPDLETPNLESEATDV